MSWIESTITGVLAAAIFALSVWAVAKVKLQRERRAWEKSLGGRIQAAGVSNFFASRADYARYRDAPKLTDYLARAHRTIDVAAYWMATGSETENIGDELGAMLEANPDLRARIAIIDPTSDYLGALADYLGMSELQLRDRLEASLASLAAAHDRLGDRTQARFDLRVYRTLPVASVVMLDVGEPSGRIQLDVKPYRASRSDSFGIELSPSDLYHVTRKAWMQLIDSAEQFDRGRHLRARP